jgi:hypothetical protein
VTFTGYTDSSSPKIAYGGLPGVFKLVGLHFHWGSDDSQGSEHRVDNRAFSAEVGIGASSMNFAEFNTVVEFELIIAWDLNIMWRTWLTQLRWIIYEL